MPNATLQQDATTHSGSRKTGEPESLAQYTARIALRCAWIVGASLALLVLLLNLNRNPIPMLEDNRSFGLLALYFIVPAALVVTWITFVLGIHAWNARVPENRQRRWKVAVLPISIAYALLLGLITAVALQLAEPAFPALALDRFQAAFVVGLGGAGLTNWMVNQTMQLRSRDLLRIAIIIVAAGVYLSVSSADDPLWWTVSFSSVGTHKTFTSWLFNTTLVFGGLLILVWLPYFAIDLDVLVRHDLTTEDKAKWVRYGLIGLGIAIGLVGAFENRVSEIGDFIHNLSAPMMGVIVIIMALSLRWLIPGFSAEMYTTSLFLALTLIAGVVFVMIGYFNTAGITIYGAAVAFTWLILFVGTVEQTAEELEPAAFPA